MMGKHTPEPWAVDEFYGLIRDGQPDEEPILEAESFCERCGAFREEQVLAYRADLDRICSCVNACAGINPEAVPDLLNACRGLLDAAENNEVLIDSEWGTVRSLAQIEADGDLPAEIVAARAAIAKATEGQSCE